MDGPPASAPRTTIHRRPWVAVILSLGQLGLGQVYGGSVVRGVALGLGGLFVALVSSDWLQHLFSQESRQNSWMLWHAMLIYVAVLGYTTFVTIDAFRVTRQTQALPRGRLNKWYVHLTLIIAIGLVHEMAGPDRYVRAFWLPSGSMQPTLLIGDYVWADQRTYAVGTLPERGHVVAYTRPSDATILICRVIALAGDEIEIRKRQVYLNGIAIDEPYAHFERPPASGSRDNMEKQMVPPDSFFVLGDNRDLSYDSRFWGFAHVDGLIGRITWLYWSRGDGWPRWERIGRWVE